MSMAMARWIQTTSLLPFSPLLTRQCRGQVAANSLVNPEDAAQPQAKCNEFEKYVLLRISRIQQVAQNGILGHLLVFVWSSRWMLHASMLLPAASGIGALFLRARHCWQ